MLDPAQIKKIDAVLAAAPNATTLSGKIQHWSLPMLAEAESRCKSLDRGFHQEEFGAVIRKLREEKHAAEALRIAAEARVWQTQVERAILAVPVTLVLKRFLKTLPAEHLDYAESKIPSCTALMARDNVRQAIAEARENLSQKMIAASQTNNAKQAHAPRNEKPITPHPSKNQVKKAQGIATTPATRLPVKATHDREAKVQPAHTNFLKDTPLRAPHELERAAQLSLPLKKELSLFNARVNAFTSALEIACAGGATEAAIQHAYELWDTSQNTGATKALTKKLAYALYDCAITLDEHAMTRDSLVGRVAAALNNLPLNEEVRRIRCAGKSDGGLFWLATICPENLLIVLRSPNPGIQPKVIQRIEPVTLLFVERNKLLKAYQRLTSLPEAASALSDTMYHRTATPWHAAYFAHELTRAGASGELDSIGRALFDSRVDLNPHQVEAALFALRNPLQKGVVLADEVGLGKTIEAGLVLCQHWAERRRKLIVVCPAHLRKQWSLELGEKFGVPSSVVDSRIYRERRKAGELAPFDHGDVAIVSYAYAARMKDELRAVAWDLVVFDEAHKLRNAYRPASRGGQALKWAFELRQKLLLTATPLQNSLLELYGLGWMIDDNLFGDKDTFNSRYAGAGGDIDGLRARLAQFCKRTLRKDVLEYVKYTRRHAITHPFAPSTAENDLARDIGEFLADEDSYALPRRQRHLVSMIVQKVLASSPVALAKTLRVILKRLEDMRDGLTEEEKRDFLTALSQDEDMELDDLREYFEGELDDAADDERDEDKIDPRRLAADIEKIKNLILAAEALKGDSKSEALLAALRTGFDRMRILGGAKKALVFTESRRTQEFLAAFLEKNGYAGKVVVFNGSNNHPQAVSTLEDWQRRHAGSDRVTGSRSVDVRTALTDRFREDAKAEILIATEAASEGVNLQFCSLVVNYDLPWNPQRIEQRIGRCHRYGQKHDVVVINFLNRDNPADRRVQQLLQDKFHLFEGLFGASDQVLGAIESGVDFEQRVLAIYRTCRTPETIEQAFDRLRDELETQIADRMAKTRETLFENFDGDVVTRLKSAERDARDLLDRLGKLFWRLVRWSLADRAVFDEPALALDLPEPSPFASVPTGRYSLLSRAKEGVFDGHLLRLGSPLGRVVIDAGLTAPVPPARLCFDLTGQSPRITMLEPFKGKAGWLRLEKLRIVSDTTEEFLLWTAVDDAGHNLPAEVAARLFDLEAVAHDHPAPDAVALTRLDKDAERLRDATLARAAETGHARFKQAREQVERYAEDIVKSAELKLEQIKTDIRAARRQADLAETDDRRLESLHLVENLEKQKREARDRIFEVEDEAEEKRRTLIDALRARTRRRSETLPVFVIRWEVV